MLRSDYSQLIILLQAALGEMPKSVEKELDLKALFKLSQQQEVVALALDGLQKFIQWCVEGGCSNKGGEDAMDRKFDGTRKAICSKLLCSQGSF